MAYAFNTDSVRGIPVTGGGLAYPDHIVHVKRVARLVPASGGTEQIFAVYGGKVLVRKLYGIATVLFDATNPVMKFSHQAVNAARSTVIGTAVDVASTVSLSNLEVGGSTFVEGDGTAMVKANAGSILQGANQGNWIAPIGNTYITTGGTNATGFMEYHMWYTPLDEGAYVISVDTVTAKV